LFCFLWQLKYKIILYKDVFIFYQIATRAVQEEKTDNFIG